MDITVFEHIKQNLTALSLEEIKGLIQNAMNGRTVRTPLLNSGHHLYRARKLGKDFIKEAGIRLAQLSYPPASSTRIGRLNRDGSPLFYSSTCKEAVFFELDLKAGDEIVLSIWETTEPALVNHLGYTEPVFQTLGSTRNLPAWTQEAAAACLEVPPNTTASNVGVAGRPMSGDVFSQLFSEVVQPSDQEKYKLTSAIAELHYESIDHDTHRFAGILYPSVRMRANGDNLALMPWFADAHLRFKKATHIRIDAAEAHKFSVTSLDTAISSDAAGLLQWSGNRPLIHFKNPISFQFLAGVDEHGDYILGANQLIGHWGCTDNVTGERLYPA